MKEYSRLKSYGIDTLLTNQDDPALWEAALRQHWPSPKSPECLVDALRFNIGRCLLEGELPQGEVNEQHAKMRGMVDIEEWCFERVGEAQLWIKLCPQVTTTIPVSYPGMFSLATLMSGQAPFTPPPQTIFMYLGISRPSRDIEQVVVYAAWSAPGAGEGAAHIWMRQDVGVWKQSDQCVTRWTA
jgi:hypothetical protein